MLPPEELVKGLNSQIMVIGGCGLLGHHIVKFLLENGKPGNEISVFDISTKSNLYPVIAYITGDLSIKNDVKIAFICMRPRILINVASPDAMTPDKRVLARCNVGYGVIQKSYKDLVWVTEDWPVLENPVDGSEYAKTKAIGEGIVVRANRQKGLLTTAIRLCTLFGEGDVVITRHFIEFGRAGKLRFHVGQGQNMYDFIYARNAAEGHLLASYALLQASKRTESIDQQKRVEGKVFNLTNGNPWLFWGLAWAISTLAGYPIHEKDVWNIPMNVVCFFLSIWELTYWIITFGGEPEVKEKMVRYTEQIRTSDITKAKERLEYEPCVGMEEGLRRSVNWHMSKATSKTGLKLKP